MSEGVTNRSPDIHSPQYVVIVMLRRWTERLYEIRQGLSGETSHLKRKCFVYPTMFIVTLLYKEDIYYRIYLIVMLPYLQPPNPFLRTLHTESHFDLWVVNDLTP